MNIRSLSGENYLLDHMGYVDPDDLIEKDTMNEIYVYLLIPVLISMIIAFISAVRVFNGI